MTVALYQILFGLLRTESIELGFEFIDVPGYQLEEGLGTGRFAKVYRGTRLTDNASVVLKVYDFVGSVDTVERDVLKRLAGYELIRDNIPALVGNHSIGIKYCVNIVRPVGMSLPGDKFFDPAMAKKLVDILQVAHAMNIIHRDVKPDNIYFDRANADRIILNDWSSSVRSNQECVFAGTRLFASRPVNGRHVPTPQLDLCSLVKTVFCFVHTKNPAVGDDWDNIEQFWASVCAKFASFTRLMQLANNCDYDGIRREFEANIL
jgi:serine/threonine protein kinase